MIYPMVKLFYLFGLGSNLFCLLKRSISLARLIIWLARVMIKPFDLYKTLKCQRWIQVVCRYSGFLFCVLQILYKLLTLVFLCKTCANKKGSQKQKLLKPFFIRWEHTGSNRGPSACKLYFFPLLNLYHLLLKCSKTPTAIDFRLNGVAFLL